MSLRTSLPCAALLIAVAAGTSCILDIPIEAPFAFTDVTFTSRAADDGVAELVLGFGIENRSEASVEQVSARAYLYRDTPEPEFLLSIQSESRIEIAPGERAGIEVVLNPMLYYDPGPALFIDGLQIVELTYSRGDPWRNRLGQFIYPYEVALTQGASE